MPTYQEALKINEQYARDNGKEVSGVKLLMLHFSALSGAGLIAKMQEDMHPAAYKAFLKAVDEYVIDNRPVQYITQHECFYGHDFNVNQNVLIPRFETEELVAYLLEIKDTYFGTRKTRLLDVGTGSGCLAITLSLEDADIEAHATDISEAALETARMNNEKLDSNVTFYSGNLLEPVYGQRFDILVSNPPYIPDKERLEPLIADHEPHVALFGGKDGLDYYRAILKDAEKVLNERYIIAFEHAWDKAKEIRKLCKKYLKHVRIIQKEDMQGRDRMTFVMKKR